MVMTMRYIVDLVVDDLSAIGRRAHSARIIELLWLKLLLLNDQLALQVGHVVQRARFELLHFFVGQLDVDLYVLRDLGDGLRQQEHDLPRLIQLDDYIYVDVVQIGHVAEHLASSFGRALPTRGELLHFVVVEFHALLHGRQKAEGLVVETVRIVLADGYLHAGVFFDVLQVMLIKVE